MDYLCNMKQRDPASASIYLETLRTMGSEKRLQKAFELSAFAKQLFIYGLRKRHPGINKKEFNTLLIQEFAKCHNRNY